MTTHYTALDFKKGIPDQFRTYCHVALDCAAMKGLIPLESVKMINGVSVGFVEFSYESV